MITMVAVCPSAPLLLPEYAGRTDVGAGLRKACVAAVRKVTASAERVVVLVASDRAPRSTRTPLGLRVGTLLVARAEVPVRVDVVEVPWDASVDDAVVVGRQLAATPERTSLLVIADGSAHRAGEAPGHLVKRALAVDDQIVTALRDGDPGRLLHLDPEVCADLLVGGRAPLQAMAAAMADAPGRFAATVRVQEPFGVLYVVATLMLCPARSPRA